MVMNENDKCLSVYEAYAAMFVFLDAYWERGNRADEQIASLLSSMQLATDRRPFDPAQWEDWIDAINHVRARYGSELITLSS